MTRISLKSKVIELLLALTSTLLCAHHVSAQSFDHQAHAVPGPDQVVYDSDGNGSEVVTVDGVLSHSHYFDAGPPAVNGMITKYQWTNNGNGAVLCEQQKCQLTLSVGKITIKLTVTDNVGDVASDTMTVSVLPASQAGGPPKISAISPTSGPAAGGTTVTIDGSNFFKDSVVFFGNNAVQGANIASATKIILTAPGAGPGAVQVTVKTSQGTSNGIGYTYTGDPDSGPQVSSGEWKNADGSTFSQAQEVTGITVGPDGRYYLCTLTGIVHAVSVGKDFKVQSSCSGAQMPPDRAIYGIAWNPADKSKRLVVTTNTMFHKSKGAAWYNGAVEFVNIDGGGGCVSRGPVIMSGLPVSNHDHGVNKIAFQPNGYMLVTVGGSSNAGYTDPQGDNLGGVPESPLSASIIIADYLNPSFNGAVKYDQVTNPETANKISGSMSVYAAGFRNSFGIVRTLGGAVYVTDNGPNSGFGKKSTSCTTEGPDPSLPDSLFKVQQGGYFGHANRNRGRDDPRQCVWRGPGSTSPIGTMESSTTGIVEYTGNIAGFKGNLFLTKLALGSSTGKVFRVELDGNGNVAKGPYEFWGESGLSVVQGQYGELVMPQLRKSRVVVLSLQTPASGASVRTMRTPAVHHVHPKHVHKDGGELLISGSFFDVHAKVLVNGRPCLNVRDVTPSTLRCTAPLGTGTATVSVSIDGISSISHGLDFTYVG